MLKHPLRPSQTKLQLSKLLPSSSARGDSCVVFLPPPLQTTTVVAPKGVGEEECVQIDKSVVVGLGVLLSGEEGGVLVNWVKRVTGQVSTGERGCSVKFLLGEEHSDDDDGPLPGVVLRVAPDALDDLAVSFERKEETRCPPMVPPLRGQQWRPIAGENVKFVVAREEDDEEGRLQLAVGSRCVAWIQAPIGTGVRIEILGTGKMPFLLFSTECKPFLSFLLSLLPKGFFFLSLNFSVCNTRRSYFWPAANTGKGFDLVVF